MGDFSMTCSISGLGISGGTPVRCLLLTASPYSNDDPRRGDWIVRTPPLRAVYNGYGTIEEVHTDDKFIADLWLRGLREDLIERDLGDNSVHDVPTARDMSFEELLDAVRGGRVVVRQDAKHFWQRPRKDDAWGLAASKDHVSGPRWDIDKDQRADQDKHLTVAMGMIREDVWQALAHYPHSDPVKIDCTNCGQSPFYHEKDRQCPGKSINDKPLREHPRGSRYAHGPVFPDGVEHVVVPRDYGEDVWYDLAAYRDGTRKAWTEILEHFSDTPSICRLVSVTPHETCMQDDVKDAALPSLTASISQIDEFVLLMESAQKKEAARIAELPAEARAKLEAERRARVDAWEAEEQERRANPNFGDFLINNLIGSASHRPGAWLFCDSSVPGVINVKDHLSMCLADKLEVPLGVLDAIAELAAVRYVIGGVGVTWKPAASTGPQYPEWDQHLRFTRTLSKIAEGCMKRDQAEHADDSDDCDSKRTAIYATLAEVMRGETV